MLFQLTKIKVKRGYESKSINLINKDNKIYRANSDTFCCLFWVEQAICLQRTSIASLLEQHCLIACIFCISLSTLLWLRRKNSFATRAQIWEVKKVLWPGMYSRAARWRVNLQVRSKSFIGAWRLYIFSHIFWSGHDCWYDPVIFTEPMSRFVYKVKYSVEKTNLPRKHKLTG